MNTKLFPLLYCLVLIALCTVFNSITTPAKVYNDDLDMVIFPYWEKADSTYYDSIPGDLRMTDTWCEIASGQPVSLGPEVSRYKYIDTLEFPNWEVADTIYYEQYPGDERYTDIWDSVARLPVKKLFPGHTCSDEDRNVTYLK